MERIASSQSITHRGGSVLEHTLAGISQSLEHSLFAEEISKRAGFFQSLEARVKILSILALLLAASLSRNLWVILAIYLLALALAVLSAIPAGFFIKRVWLALPFFTGLVALPALFITPGPVILSLPAGLVITRTGLVSVLFLLLRVSASVSLGLLLIFTTPWNSLLNALRILHVPDIFVLILGMTYRYIYLLLHTANDMFLSRKSRVVGRLSGGEARRVMAASTAALLAKSLDLSSDVYLAMQSRGFSGMVVPLKPARLQRRDISWLGIFLFISAVLVILGR